MRRNVAAAVSGIKSPPDRAYSARGRVTRYPRSGDLVNNIARAGMASNMAIDNDARSWTKILAQYRRPSTARSTIEIAITVLPFAVLWVVSALAVTYGYWWGLLLTIPAAGFLVRLFALQHDCGHGALFSRRGANDWTGRAIGVLTFTPYDYWRRTHAIHHASAGNLDQRGTGDIHTLTVREYRALPWLGRAQYWLYRHPVVMFGVGPAWVFLCQYRLPLGLMRAGAQPWVSTIATNLGIAVPTAVLIWLLGIWPFLMIQLPITLLAATTGVWLFFVQHQFEDTHWSPAEDSEFPACGAARKLSLRASRRASVVHRKHRHPPRTPSVEHGSVLPVTGGPARLSRTARRRSHRHSGEPSLRQVGAVGRTRPPPRLVPGNARSSPHRLSNPVIRRFRR